MIYGPVDAPTPTLDARWIIALWVAIHGTRANSAAGGELILEAATVRAAAGNAILALASQFDPATAQALRAALRKLPESFEPVSDAQIEDALKRLGIRLHDQTGAEDTVLNGLSVAGFGKICWTGRPA
ncbi:MAG TPA: hypothetical protein VGV37_01030 [Aliidongia sp.]|uniref:hypothetical protein n=1 Tax=Aliidongia sp. TaxID=1914230 RepID=UPI002DDCBA03|nr:hypothetical protein [Aliidongia sp.]HEV2673090.1 hypothetical protein [Aliidongia sp.]